MKRPSAMDEYAFYIWSSYAVAGVVLVVLAVASIVGARFADRTVEALRALKGRTRRSGGRSASRDSIPMETQVPAEEDGHGR